MDLIATLLLGNFAFTAGAYAFVWTVYNRLSDKINNHMEHELELLRSHLRGDCSDSCVYEHNKEES